MVLEATGHYMKKSYGGIDLILFKNQNDLGAKGETQNP